VPLERQSFRREHDVLRGGQRADGYRHHWREKKDLHGDDIDPQQDFAETAPEAFGHTAMHYDLPTDSVLPLEAGEAARKGPIRQARRWSRPPGSPTCRRRMASSAAPCPADR